MSCYIALWWKDAVLAFMISTMPTLDECQVHVERINNDFQYELKFAYCQKICWCPNPNTW